MTVFCFEGFELQPATRRLLIRNRSVQIGMRAYDLLLALVERRDRVVSKDELLDLVWPQLIVEENNLQVHIRTLRKLLGAETITTVPRQGYQFTAALRADSRRVTTDETVAAEMRPDRPIPGVSEMAGGHAGRIRAPVSRGSPTGAPSAAAAAGNLPATIPELYGREAVVTNLTELVTSQRLVTVAGPSGMGKTRVAQAVAHRLRSRFAHGTWVIELAQVQDEARLIEVIAQTLGIVVATSELATSLLRRSLTTALRGHDLLLVLDNCEHLSMPVAELCGQVLADTDSVRMLITSQVPLHSTGERVYRLQPLSVPSRPDLERARPDLERALPDLERAAPSIERAQIERAPANLERAVASIERAQRTLEQALDHGAVRLFVERAKVIDLNFQLDSHNVAAVISICGRLDGVALAIELAAAQVATLTVQGVLDRLSARLGMRTNSSAATLGRHQTLRAALDWSFDLLSPAERAVLRRLGVFADGFVIETAQAVCGDDDIDEWAVLDILGTLVDRSFVIVDPNALRYRMHGTTHAYAQERLIEAGEEERSLRRHAEATLALCQAAVKQHDAALLAAEMNNVRAAYAWAMQDLRAPSLAVGLVAATAMPMAMRGLEDESLRRLVEVEPLLTDSSRTDSSQTDSSRADSSRTDLSQIDPARADSSRVSRSESAGADALRAESIPLPVAACYWEWLGRSGGAGRLSATRVLAALSRAEAIYSQLGEAQRAHACKCIRAETLAVTNQVEQAYTELRAAQAMESRGWPVAERAQRLRVLALLQAVEGQPDLALETAQLALDLAEAAGLDSEVLKLFELIACTHLHLKNAVRATEAFGELVARAHQSPSGEFMVVRGIIGMMAAALISTAKESSAETASLQAALEALGRALSIGGATSEPGLMNVTTPAQLTRYALPILRRRRLLLVSCDLLSWVAANEGNYLQAAQLLGAADATYQDSRILRDAICMTAHTVASQMIDAAESPEKVQQAMATGAALGEEDVGRIIEKICPP